VAAISGLKNEILREVGAVARCIQSISDIKYREIKLQRGQFIFLTRICEHPGINLIELSGLLKVDKTSTTKAIQKLLAEGYVLRERDGTDKRMWRLVPSLPPEPWPCIRTSSPRRTAASTSVSPALATKSGPRPTACCGACAATSSRNGWSRKSPEESKMATITVKEYSSPYKEQVIAHILAIQRGEFNIAISREDQPDLDDIENFYQAGAGNFWLALVGGQIVGTVALIDIGNRQGALRKMFVSAAYRGAGHNTAGLLLNTLLSWAGEQGLREIYLGTTAKFIAAHRFYEKNAFAEIPKEDLPAAFPVMKVDSKFYKYSL